MILKIITFFWSVAIILYFGYKLIRRIFEKPKTTDDKDHFRCWAHWENEDEHNSIW